MPLALSSALSAKMVESSQMQEEFTLLARKSKSVDIAVAYLKTGGMEMLSEPLGSLLKRRGSCRFAVGLSRHFITHPLAVKELLELKDTIGRDKLELRYSSRVGFHPKLMFFARAKGRASALVGSSNLTSGGVNGGNLEANVRLDGPDDERVFKQIKKKFAKMMSKPLTKTLNWDRYNEYLTDYEARPKGNSSSSKPSLEQTGGTGKPPSRPDTGEGEDEDVEDLDLQRATGSVFWKFSPGEGAFQWPEYLRRINPLSREGVIGLGYTELGDPTGLTRDEIMDRMTHGSVKKWKDNPGYHSGQVMTFCRIVHRDDVILVYGKGAVLGMAKVLDDKAFRAKGDNDKLYLNQRKVLWKYAGKEGIKLLRSEERRFRFPEDTLHSLSEEEVPQRVLDLIESRSLEDRGTQVGWILVHSMEKEDPREETRKYEKRGKEFPWHWKLAYPLEEGGPHTVLFSYDKEVFAHGTAYVVHKIDQRWRPEYNFAFQVVKISVPGKEVPLGSLPLGNRVTQHRSIITLDEETLRAYQTRIRAE